MDRFEDTDMWRRISKYCRIDAISIVTCKIRTHHGNAIASQSADAIVSSLEYYKNKIECEDEEYGRDVIYNGLSRIYGYYSSAFQTVPGFAREAGELLSLSAEYKYQAKCENCLVRVASCIVYQSYKIFRYRPFFYIHPVLRRIRNLLS
jgi:hypothetical protein